MRYRITVKKDAGPAETLFGIGDPNAAADAFYDAGYLGVTVVVLS